MSIRKYQNSKGTFYEAFTYLGVDPYTGKQVRPHKKGFKKKTDAQRWIDQTRAAGLNHFEKEPKKLKVKEIYEQWLEIYRFEVRPSTYLKTTQLFEQHIIAVIGNHYMSKITTHQLQVLVNDWSTRFVKYKMMTGYLKRLFAYAATHDLITRNPCDKLIMPRKQKKTESKKSYYTVEELAIFLETCAQDDNPMALPLFRLFAYTGLRRQEILALTWTDIDWQQSLLTINKAITTDYDYSLVVGDTKNETSNRVIALDQSTLNIMHQWRVQSPNAFKKNTPIFNIGISTPNNMLKRLAKKAGLEPLSPHKLRHTHCTLAIQSGANIKDVQARLGHSDIETTLAIYAHADNNVQKIADDFAAFADHAM